MPVDGTEEVQLDRLRYLLSNGVKEGLVRRATDWPGASSLPWLLHGEEVYGTWVDRTKRYYNNRRKNPLPDEFEERLRIEFTPLPCFDGVPPDQWREQVRGIVASIEREADLARQAGDLPPPLGAKAAAMVEPQTIPAETKVTPLPVVHASDNPTKKRWKRRLEKLRAEYAVASFAWCRGYFGTRFPEGTFRPSGGHVSWQARAVERDEWLEAA